MKKIACMAVCIALLVFLIAPVASAQLLDGQWFELKIKSKGLLRNISTEEVTPASYSAVAYLNLQWDNISGGYDYAVRSWDSDSWKTTSGEDSFVYGANENIIPTLTFRSWLSNMEWFSLDPQMSFKIKRDTSGLFKSATTSSLSCGAYGTLTGHRFYGGCTIKGKAIDPSNLPFTP